MNISFLHKPLGFLLFVVILGVIICKPIGCTINAIETGIIKRFNSEYTTYREAEEKEKIEQVKIAEQEKKRIADEIALENAEDFKKRQMWLRIDGKKVRDSLKKKGYDFHVYNLWVLDNFVWVCGYYKTNGEKNYYYPTIATSEDGGNNYKLSKSFKEFEGFCSINIFFLEKHKGYLSIYTNAGYFIIYSTSDSGHTWKEILSTKNAAQSYHMNIGYVKRIRVSGQNIYLIISFQSEGFYDLIESDDGGKSWTYKCDNRVVARTKDMGETWQVEK